MVLTGILWDGPIQLKTGTVQLQDRGRIAQGYAADLVVFDADRVIATSSYDDPEQYPVGIPYVLVNGVIAVDAERCTGSMSGQALRRS